MTLETFLNLGAAQSIGWALLHFVWQGTLLAAFLLAANAMTRPAQARVRYALACLAMLLMPIFFVATILRLHPSATPSHVAKAGPSTVRQIHSEIVVTTDRSQASTENISPAWRRRQLAGWAAFLWLTGVAAFAIFTFVGWGRARRLTRHGVEPAASALVEMLESLRQRLRISKQVELCVSAIAEVPAVIGWLRPYILLPISTITGLSEAELRAILAHELAHIRRHDYLVNLLQNAVETLLFYHPAVWWVSRCIRTEREHCCDDIAVAICGDPMAYACALTQLEELRGSIGEPALAATGGDLLGRIRRLVDHSEQRSRIAGSAFAAIAVTLILGAMIAAATPQTSPAPRVLKFDVASVRQAGKYNGGPAGGARVEGKRLIADYAGLTDLIDFAWDVQDFQISGGPSWKEGGILDGPNRFHIEAKVDGDETPTIEQMRLMLRSLLAERFNLKIHMEKKSFPAWDLVVDKGGPKLKPTTEGAVRSLQVDGRKGPRMSVTAIAFSIEDMDKQGWLRQFSGRPVVNKTGLTGKYDFQLQWTSDLAKADTELPDFATALRDQLGLRLQSSTAPLDALTIESAERPSEN